MDPEGNLLDTGVIATCLWSPAPYLVLVTQAPPTQSSSGAGGGGATVEGSGSHEPQLLPLPPSALLRRFPVPAVGALMGWGGGVAALASLREQVKAWASAPGALWGAADGYGLSRYLVSKAVGVSWQAKPPHR